MYIIIENMLSGGTTYRTVFMNNPISGIICPEGKPSAFVGGSSA
jgi:hypothetical protein